MLDAGGQIDLNPINPTHQWLQVLGLAGRRGGRLIFRNRLYAELAHSARVPGAGQPPAPIVDPSPANLDEKLFDAIGDTTLRGLALDAAAERSRRMTADTTGWPSSPSDQRSKPCFWRT
ncbi:MAG: hypothetical protein M3R46_14755 [Actinomycetota bacterium]|jgi:hypothetical protein|nr:hypothetical protein [Actinomycetota bacterium]